MFSFFLFAIKYPSLWDDWTEGKLAAETAALAKYKKTDSSGFRRISQPIAARSGARGQSWPVPDGDLGSACMSARKLRGGADQDGSAGSSIYKKTDGKV